MASSDRGRVSAAVVAPVAVAAPAAVVAPAASTSPHRRLSVQLVVSHLLVAVVAMLTTGALVLLLAPQRFNQLGQQGWAGQNTGGQNTGAQDTGGRSGTPGARADSSGTLPDSAESAPDLLPTPRGTTGELINAQLHEAIVHSLIWGLVAGLITAALLGFLLSRRLMESINTVRSATRVLATGNYTARIPLPRTTELAHLGADIQTMANQLADTEQRRMQLLGEVGHEMRTPLTVIDGQVEAMIDGVLPMDEAELTIIAAESRRLHRLANDLSTLSKVEEGRISLELQEVDFSQLINDSTARLAPSIMDAGITLNRQIQPNIQLIVDPERIAQIITNLLTNARHATPAGGTITVTCEGDNDAVTLTVSDTGEGLTPEDQERIFERFYRVPQMASRSTGARQDTGSGIGLPISRKLAEYHSGSLTVSSLGIGQGATFVLELPALRA
ncbi:MAG: HAMP domain-containing sensor histidine kinase [Arcanobacterium sp.]